MQDLQLVIESIFTNLTNQLIIVLAMVNAYFMFQTKKHIQSLKKELFEGETLLERFLKANFGKQTDINESILRDFSKWEGMYQNTTKWYHLSTSIIGIFPLMGIAGTIIGIIPSLNDFSKVGEYFSLALVSTLLGVVFTVLFKFVEGWLSGDYTIISERIHTLTNDVAKYLIQKDRDEKS